MTPRNPLTRMTCLPCLLAVLLAGCGPPKSIRRLGDPDAAKRLAAVQAVGRMGPKARDAVPRLLQIARTPGDVKLRCAAMRAVGKIGPTDRDQAADVLAEALRDSCAPIRRAAVEAIGMVTPFPEGAFPALVSVLGDDDSVAAAMASGLLVDLVPGSNRALCRALQDNDPVIRCMAAKALGSLGPEARFATADLTKNLGFGNITVRQCTAEALEKIGAGPGGNGLTKKRLPTEDW